ncbi:hypothetical protein [Streptomyces sp. CB00316]|nr:hypothetical protein [Streptomyces sp. CB00316]
MVRQLTCTTPCGAQREKAATDLLGADSEELKAVSGWTGVNVT